MKTKHKQIKVEGLSLMFAIMLVVVQFSCKKSSDQSNDGCSHDFNANTITAKATVGNFNWYTNYKRSLLFTLPAYSINCTKTTTEFSLIGYIDINKTAGASNVTFKLVTNSYVFQRFSELDKLNGISIELNDSNNYIILEHYFADHLLEDTISPTVKIISGNITFSKVFKVCSGTVITKDGESTRSLRAIGEFNFQIPNASNPLLTKGNFDLYISPLNDRITFQ